MFPLVHPGVAYLIYSGLVRATGGRHPGDVATLALVIGALLPDLVDQPLYHLLDLPTTRTLAHSLLVAIPLCLLVWLVVRRTRLPDPTAAGFAVGYISHLAADALWPLLLGKHGELGFLLWPLTPSPPYVGQKPLTTIGDVTVTTLWIELPLLAAALVLWYHHGTPGLRPLREQLQQRRSE